MSKKNRSRRKAIRGGTAPPKSRRRAQQPTRHEDQDPNVTHLNIAPPEAALQPLFLLVDEIARAGENAIAPATEVGTGTGPIKGPLSQFDTAQLLRGWTGLLSVRTLCAEAFWESASATVRQLFELVLGMEHLQTLPDRFEGTRRYIKFGVMQQIEHERQRLLHAKQAGREVDDDDLAKLDLTLGRDFPEFRTITQSGKIDVKRSWSGFNTSRLARDSSDPHRIAQYDVLFRIWSAQAHGAPAALIDYINLPTEEDLVDSIKQMIGNHEARIAETMSIAAALFLDLWALLPHVPAVDGDQRRKWIVAAVDMSTQYGGEAPIGYSVF